MQVHLVQRRQRQSHHEAFARPAEASQHLAQQRRIVHRQHPSPLTGLAVCKH